MVEPELEIDCIDCGERCHLITKPDDLGWQPGDLVVYRCTGCGDRWDLVLPEEGE